MVNLDRYRNLFLQYLSQKVEKGQPNNLYEPIEYILNLGGKRLRPVLVLMSCDIFGGKSAQSLDAAVAIEMFHNFTLIHDDIMDSAPIRRGKETVHKKWNSNTGILSGDALLILAYKMFDSYTDTYKPLLQLFNKTALEVCEGQQYDMDFETQNGIELNQYLKMISYKTAVLIATALKMGAIIAKADKRDTENIYNFGLNLGMAFQLQDDYLDVFADAAFGKQKAGDIIENKKTFLFIKCLELASDEDKMKLFNLYSENKNAQEKVDKVVALFNKYNTSEILKDEIENYTRKALKCVDKLSINTAGKEILKTFSENLMYRTI
ncbi:MAG: polyprenyl synthetase family protein [Flavobacteriaceae bacterium]|nr:polyprenyl synthetase family protein [Flavobacteriaceae bacterium]